MNLNPKDLFLGLLDFFTILLPGALLAYVLQGTAVAEPVLPKAVEKMSDGERWMVLAVSSYLLGQFLFLAGSWLDECYDYARTRTLEYRIRRLWRTKHLSSRFWRALSGLVFRRERNVAVDRATRIRKRQLAPLDAQGAINTFRWTKTPLALEKPEALEIVQRFEADSKFFRSVAPLLLLLPILRDWGSYRFLLTLETTSRDVHEETGVWAEVESEIGVVCYDQNQEPVHARFFLMRKREEPYLNNPLREHQWFSHEQAERDAAFPEVKMLLKIAEERRTKSNGTRIPETA